jgi:hypothetical protein
LSLIAVATCETPASAVKLLTGRLKDADVVFIDALRAASCGFDFRAMVEPNMCIPVIYCKHCTHRVDALHIASDDSSCS